jgi:hypothetical protein
VIGRIRTKVVLEAQQGIEELVWVDVLEAVEQHAVRLDDLFVLRFVRCLYEIQGAVRQPFKHGIPF